MCTTTESLENNELVQCSGCQDHWHQQCHDPVIYNAFAEPESGDQFWCKRCDHVCESCQGKGSNHSYRKDKKSEEYDALVACKCGKWYHQDCVTPRIDSQYIDPRNVWKKCPACKASVSGAAQKASGKKAVENAETEKSGAGGNAPSTSDENTASGSGDANATASDIGDGSSDADDQSNGAGDKIPPSKPPVVRRRSARQSLAKAGKTSPNAHPSGPGKGGDNGQASITPPRVHRKKSIAKIDPISEVQTERETGPPDRRRSTRQSGKKKHG